MAEGYPGAVGPTGQLLTNLIPELEPIIGKQPPVPELPPQETRNRFQAVFRRFLCVFAQKEHPLTLFLDDLQWLDVATLSFIEHLLMYLEVKHLLIVGAYRDNEVSPSHPLTLTLGSIRKAGVTVDEIVLKPLSFKDVNHFIADALRCEPERSEALAELVHQNGGQPFLCNPVPHCPRRGTPGGIRRSQNSLAMGSDPDSHPGFHRQRGGAHD